MDFDEWFNAPDSAQEQDREPDDGISFTLKASAYEYWMRLCWQAAQKEAARRCAEIARSELAFDTNAWDAIEREFGLDRHE